MKKASWMPKYPNLAPGLRPGRANGQEQRMEVIESYIQYRGELDVWLLNLRMEAYIPRIKLANDGWFNQMLELESDESCSMSLISKRRLNVVLPFQKEKYRSSFVSSSPDAVLPIPIDAKRCAKRHVHRAQRTLHAMSHTRNPCMQTIIYSYHRTHEIPCFHTSLLLILLLRRPRHLLVGIRTSLPHLPCALPFPLVRPSLTVFVLVWVVMSSLSPVSTYRSCSTIIA